jgi:soluble lytic murein transglycosylase
LNLELGTSYLAWELKRFQGRLPLALAAYNGGGGNVRKWQKNKQKDFDYWLESIPFPETKNYVKKVMRSYYLYQYLYQWN